MPDTPASSALPLAGRMALITGGSGGIATACAASLLRDGCSVTLTARREPELAAAAERLRALAPDGTEVRHIAADACTTEGVRAAVDAATAPDGRLHICLATVGGGKVSPLLAMDDEQFLDDLRRNTLSGFLAVKYATPAIAASGGGSIVMISTNAAKITWPYGLEAFVRVAADELSPLGVRVNAVRPGLVKSQEDARIFRNEELIAGYLANTPAGRTGVPDDIARAVRYLAGPESSWTTGQSIAVDGGQELRTAPSFEKLARATVGDAAVDAALAGRIPDTA
ncbi:MAG: SDR family oxidoreductase [Streptomycetaceae bacterium]|nr:SDR family oxidoreductase [Streptomycetaceae bacterium]